MKFFLPIILLGINLISCVEVLGQYTPTSTNTTTSLNDFLAGVKGATTNITVITNSRTETLIIDASHEYLKEMGFGSTKGDKQIGRSLCLLADVDFDYKQINDYTITGVTLRFWSCNLDYWVFENNNVINLLEYEATSENWKNVIKKHLRQMYGYMKPSFNPAHTFKLSGGDKTDYNEENLREYYASNRLAAIEGIYEISFPNESTPKYKLGLIKSSEAYKLIYLSGAQNDLDWRIGDVKAILTPTASQNLYKAVWYMSNKTKDDALVEFNAPTMKVMINSKAPAVDIYIKLFPRTEDNHGSNTETSSGSGFALSSNGYIATNYHVIADAHSITVKGINGNFSKGFSAEVISEDKSTDLAIIKIHDNSFTTLGPIPFAVSLKPYEVGSSVYVLGYPLRSTMGDEVKLTNGIISSKSGYKGDLSTYQISAAAQPGNSGGPMFDTKGNIIGIVNARHTEAENATYAIKTTYLSNLMESTSVPLKLPTINSISQKPFTEIVSQIKKFTYIIEVR